ncbi:MAG: PAS domain S-box protein [Candidatus Obscuribacterales bacterium]|jgi:PAS domain S-box-containing protein
MTNEPLAFDANRAQRRTSPNKITSKFQSEEVFRLAVNSVKDYAIFVLDPTGHIMTWNEGAQKTKGYTADEVIGKHFSIFYPEAEKAAKHPDYELEVAKQEGRYEEEGWRIKKDGSSFWANVVITALYSDQGHLIGFAKVTRDLTERRRQKMLREQSVKHEELFRLLVTSVSDYAIFLLDPQGHVMTWNEGAQRAKGYTADEIIGQHFSVFYTQESKDVNHPEYELEQAISTGRYEEEGWRIRKDGSRFWAGVTITPVYDEGRLIGFGKVTRDLSERKIAEELKEEHAQQLMESNAELQQLAYVVSHELQPPVSTIVRYGNLLNVRYKDRLGEDANEFIAKISVAGRLVARMVDDLWTYARISKPHHAGEQFNSTNTVRDAIAELERTDEFAGAMQSDTIAFDNTLPALKGDREQFVFLFKELIRNALRYRRENAAPQVSVTSEPKRGGWLFTVKDNGMGIDPVLFGEVFKVFHRLEGGPTPEATGTGLSMCKKIVERHGGELTLTSTPGLGTTVEFWLPA